MAPLEPDLANAACSGTHSQDAPAAALGSSSEGLEGSTQGVKGRTQRLWPTGDWVGLSRSSPALPQQLPAGAHPTSETQAVAFLGHNRAGHTRS